MFKVILIAVLLSNVVSLSDVTYYEILGVSKQATTKEIKQAYKKLAIRLHPDKNPEADQEKFLKITEAYETLKDPDKRHKYDVYGSYPTYTKKYDYRSQAEYNNLYYNGLYHEDPFVDTLSGGSFNNYLQEEGFHFINFYSPFCPPCQNLVDHWKKLAEVYKGIIKVGAVNCKHYNNFCYNSMRIGSYPSLLFYPHGKKGNFIYYRGDRTFESLENFVMSYLNSRINVPVISQIKSTDKPIAYVLGARRIEENALTRIAYQLRNIVTLVIVEDDTLRAKLTDNDYTTVVFKFRSTSKEIEGTEEKDILKEIVTALPKFETIDPEKFKKIRNQLRTDHKTPWLLYFSSEDNYRDVLLLHQMTVSHPKMNFGEIDCSRWPELCASLQCAGGGWAVLKAGGALQRAAPGLAAAAAAATALHSLAAGELARVLHGATGTWVLAVVPYKLSWDHILQPFMRASLHYTDSDDVSFGIMECTMHNEEVCRQVVTDQPGIIVQVGHNRHYYNGRINEGELVDFIELLRDSDDLELSEQQVLEILDAGREHTWLVAFLPAHCRRTCDALLHQWRIVARKLRPLERVRVGALRCGPQSGGFCNNVRSPTARLYPLASGYHYTVSLEHLAEAPYMLEWALEYIDDSVLKLNWHSFSKQVIAEELKPSSSGSKPWLVYFHSPRCYRCYEMYADFAITGILLNNAVHLGKVNCINERGLCQHEQVTSYPSLKLYLKRNQQNRFSSVITIPVKDYATMLPVIKPHLQRYDPNLLAGIDDNLGIKSRSFHINHDEF